MAISTAPKLELPKNYSVHSCSSPPMFGSDDKRPYYFLLFSPYNNRLFIVISFLIPFSISSILETKYSLYFLSSPPSIPRNAQLLSLGLIILVVLVNYDVLPPLVYKFLKSILSIDFLLSSSAISLFWDPKTIPIFPLRYLTYPEAGATQLFIRHPYGVESLSIPKSTCGDCGFSVQERVP